MLEMFGCKWEVVKRYELSDKEMEENNLFYKNRITIRCVEGNEFTHVGDIKDFANTSNL